MLVTAFIVLSMRSIFPQPLPSHLPVPFWVTVAVISRDVFIIVGAAAINIMTGFRGFSALLVGQAQHDGTDRRYRGHHVCGQRSPLHGLLPAHGLRRSFHVGRALRTSLHLLCFKADERGPKTGRLGRNQLRSPSKLGLPQPAKAPLSKLTTAGSHIILLLHSTRVVGGLQRVGKTRGKRK